MSGVCHSRRLSRAGGHLERQMTLPMMKRQPRSTVPVKASCFSSQPLCEAQGNGWGMLHRMVQYFQHQAGVSREMSAVSPSRVRASITGRISNKDHSEKAF